jgi:SAM-dependent methyltransferase
MLVTAARLPDNGTAQAGLALRTRGTAAANLYQNEQMTPEEIRKGIAELSPWFYPFDLGGGLRTPSKIPPEVEGIFGSRRTMVEGAARAYFGDRLPDVSCLDIGCHEGFYSVALASLGVGRVVGVDVRESNLRKARFVSEALGLSGVSFREGNCEDLRPDDIGHFELTLFLGVLYHLENPMLCLRNIARVTRELCIIETQVIDEIEGSTEWGSQAWTRRYQGALAVIDESGEFYSDDNHETGSSPLALCPSPKALLTMLKHAGFLKAEILLPPAGAYEQLARGKRVVAAAYK